MYQNTFLSVLSPAVASGNIALQFQTYNAQPNNTFTVTVTGIQAGATEQTIAYTIATQASSYFGNTGILFNGKLPTILDPVCGVFQTISTDHVTNFFSLAQFGITTTLNQTGAYLKLGERPVYTTIPAASAYGPINNQGFQLCGGGDMTQDEMADILAEASADVAAILNNNVVAAFYVYEFTTQMTNALRFPNRPVQYFWNPYTLRPTIMAMATQVATFDLNSRYEVDQESGWITFRFAQDLLFNYEPFDWNNQWRDAYIAGNYHIPTELKTAVLRWIWVIQNSFTTIKSVRDGNTAIEYSIDKNIEKRNILGPLRKYMQ